MYITFSMVVATLFVMRDKNRQVKVFEGHKRLSSKDLLSFFPGISDYERKSKAETNHRCREGPVHATL